MEKFYAAYREEALRQWTERLLAFFPRRHPGLCPSADDPFANPVGSAIRNAAGLICDAAAGLPVSQSEVRGALRALIRLCAVQERTPSQAAGFLFLLKPIFRTLFAAHAESKEGLKPLLDAESRIDTLALEAFDLFMEAREALFETRLRELRRQSAMLGRLAAAHAPGGSTAGGNAASGSGSPESKTYGTGEKQPC